LNAPPRQLTHVLPSKRNSVVADVDEQMNSPQTHSLAPPPPRFADQSREPVDPASLTLFAAGLVPPCCFSVVLLCFVFSGTPVCFGGSLAIFALWWPIAVSCVMFGIAIGSISRATNYAKRLERRHFHAAQQARVQSGSIPDSAALAPTSSMQATDKGALWMLNVIVIAVPFCSAAVAFALAQDAYHASMCALYPILHAVVVFCVLAPFFEHQLETISRITLCVASLEQLTERLKGVAAGVSMLQGSILSIALWACTPVGVRSSLNPLGNTSSIIFEELLNDQFIRCVPINMGLLFIPVLATLLHASGSARILTNAKSHRALAIINALFVISSVFTIVPLGGIFGSVRQNTAQNRTELTSVAPSTLLLWNIAVRNELTLICCGILCGCIVAIVNVSHYAVKNAQTEALRHNGQHGGVDDDLFSYHLFLSHHQEHGQDQCKNLHTSLNRMGLRSGWTMR
jgi:hypothetical protein